MYNAFLKGFGVYITIPFLGLFWRIAPFVCVNVSPSLMILFHPVKTILSILSIKFVNSRPAAGSRQAGSRQAGSKPEAGSNPEAGSKPAGKR